MLRNGYGGLCKAPTKEERRKRTAKRRERSGQVYWPYIWKMTSCRIQESKKKAIYKVWVIYTWKAKLSNQWLIWIKERFMLLNITWSYLNSRFSNLIDYFRKVVIVTTLHGGWRVGERKTFNLNTALPVSEEIDPEKAGNSALSRNCIITCTKYSKLSIAEPRCSLPRQEFLIRVHD